MRCGPAVLVALVAAAPAAAQSRHKLSDRGLDSLRQDVTIDSVDAEAWYRLGLGLFEKKRYDAADSMFQRAVHLQPWHAGAHLARAVLLRARGEGYLKDVDHHYGRDSVFALIRMAAANESEADMLEPRLDLAPLAFLKDEELVPEGAFFYLNTGGRAPRSLDPVPAMRKALRWMIEQEPESAYAILQGTMATMPMAFARGDLLSLFGSAALRAGHPEVAVIQYRQLAARTIRAEQSAAGTPFATLFTLTHAQGRYLLLYGVAEAEAHQPAVARAAFQQALTTDLGLYQAHSRLADLAESAGDLTDALQERRTAVAIAPDEARPYLDLGITLLQSGQPDSAKAALNDAASRLPWDPGIELFLFQSAMAVHDRATAQRALDALDRYAPRRNRDQVADAHRQFDQVAAP